MGEERSKPPHIQVVSRYSTAHDVPPRNEPARRIEPTVIAERISDASSSKEVPVRRPDPPALDATEHPEALQIYQDSPARSRLRSNLHARPKGMGMDRWWAITMHGQEEQ